MGNTGWKQLDESDWRDVDNPQLRLWPALPILPGILPLLPAVPPQVVVAVPLAPRREEEVSLPVRLRGAAVPAVPLLAAVVPLAPGAAGAAADRDQIPPGRDRDQPILRRRTDRAAVAPVVADRADRADLPADRDAAVTVAADATTPVTAAVVQAQVHAAVPAAPSAKIRCATRTARSSWPWRISPAARSASIGVRLAITATD